MILIANKLVFKTIFVNSCRNLRMLRSFWRICFMPRVKPRAVIVLIIENDDFVLDNSFWLTPQLGVYRMYEICDVLWS